MIVQQYNYALEDFEKAKQWHIEVFL